MDVTDRRTAAAHSCADDVRQRRGRQGPVAALRPKHARFVREYLVDLNATQAAIRAGYGAKAANRVGSRLLTNVDIAAAVRAGQQAQWAKAELTASRVLEELRRVSLVNIRGLFQADGQLKPVTEWSDEQLAAVASVDIMTVECEGAPPARVHKLRLWNKVAALDTLAKHFGLLKEKIELEGPQHVKIVYHQRIADDPRPHPRPSEDPA